MAYVQVHPEDIPENGLLDCLVYVNNWWTPCFIASERDGWFCAVFGGEWTDEGEEIIAPAEYHVPSHRVLRQVDLT